MVKHCVPDAGFLKSIGHVKSVKLIHSSTVASSRAEAAMCRIRPWYNEMNGLKESHILHIFFFFTAKKEAGTRLDAVFNRGAQRHYYFLNGSVSVQPSK